MATRITNEMIDALGGAYGIENVRRARALLVAAGVGEIELHPLELAALRAYRENERVARSACERILASGPMPPHTCTLDDDGLVDVDGDCLHGCQPRGERRESA